MRRISTLFVAALASLTLSITMAPPTAAQAPIPAVKDFWAEPDFFQPAISPNGDLLAYVKREGDEQYVVTIDLTAPGGDMKSVPVGKVRLQSIDWLTDDRLLVRFIGFYGRRSNKPIAWGEVRNRNESGEILWRSVKSQSHAAVMDREGGNTVTMFGKSPLRSQRRFNAELVYDLPSDPKHIIMQAPDEGKTHLFKVNISNGKVNRIARGSEDTGAWFVDQNGEAVLRWDFKFNGQIIHSYAKRTDEDGDEKWVRVKIGPTDTLANNGGEAFTPRAPSDQPNKYYVTARPEGTKTVSLYLYDYTTDEYGEPVRSDPNTDIATVRFNRTTTALQSVTYSGAKSVTEYLDENSQAHMDGLQQYFGPKANIGAYQSDTSEQKWLISAVIPNEGTTYVLYDKATQTPIELGNPNGAIKGKALADMDIISYTARDGMELVGYLSRPAGAQPGDKPPLIVMPHGGPEARDEYGFDIIAQSLASAGYQVFQPQFRGTSGYGLDFADAGRRQWGKAMQHDVDDGFDHLVAEGLADSNRACLMGFSYGGYAAFAGATLTPEKYRCYLAGAGVSDTARMIRWVRDDGGVIDFGQPKPGSDSYAYRYWTKHIGDLVEDREDMEAHSAARLADRIVRPMFIFHGENDRIVPIEQSRIMMTAMDRAGKPYEWHEMKQTGHSYGNNVTRSVETLEKVLDFLDRHLPVEE